MHEKRKHHYNDHRLQGLLISVLIIIELLLVIALLVYLFAEFNRGIDGRLYRIHGGHAQSWPEFVSLLAGAVGEDSPNGRLYRNEHAYLSHAVPRREPIGVRKPR